ncbi:MAG TPA: ABC transporter substrate-binding protein [Flavobacteriaceae bacterium]|nr:ABC transporter substrate-binding protein [Flavobacteriaceae bacterium]
MPKHFFKYSFLILLMTIGLASCNQGSTENRDHLVFRYNQHANISSLDPAFARNLANIWPSLQLYNGLVQFDEELNLKPDIAKHWEFNDSTNTYTFILREDVYFHKDARFGKDSTRTVIADDFVFSFDRLVDPKVASPGSWVLQQVDSYYAVNDTIFKIQLKEPFPAFLGLMAIPYCSVVPKEIVNSKETSFRNKPIGTGPFAFQLWEENVKLVLRKNPIYFEKDSTGTPLPYLEAVAVNFLPEKQNELLHFLQGSIDMISGLDASYKDELLTSDGRLQEKYRGKINLLTGPYLNTEYLGFQLETDKPELQSRKLREAINIGFDRKTMIKHLRNDMGIAANGGFIPAGLPGHSNQGGYIYDRNRARNLVQEFTKETGIENPELRVATTAEYLDICEYIQRQLELIGIKLRVDVLPPSTLLQMRAVGDLEFFRASWIADYPDAESYLSLFYSPNHTPNGPNYSHFTNKVYDSLYVASMAIQDIEQRSHLYQKMDSILLAEMATVPLFYDKAVRFVQPNVKGMKINPQNFLYLKNVYKTP